MSSPQGTSFRIAAYIARLKRRASKLVCEYSGSGGDGFIESVHLVGPDGEMTLLNRVEKTGELEEFLFKLMEHPPFMIDFYSDGESDGCYGTLTIDFAADEVLVENTIRRMAEEELEPVKCCLSTLTNRVAKE